MFISAVLLIPSLVSPLTTDHTIISLSWTPNPPSWNPIISFSQSNPDLKASSQTLRSSSAGNRNFLQNWIFLVLDISAFRLDFFFRFGFVNDESKSEPLFFFSSAYKEWRSEILRKYCRHQWDYKSDEYRHGFLLGKSETSLPFPVNI